MAPKGFLILAQVAGGSGQILIIVAMFAVMYLLLFRPQQKAMKEHKALLGALKKGDEVVIQGGLIGRIQAVTDAEVQLEIANGVKVRVLKTAVQTKRVPADAAAATATKSSSDEAKDAAKKEEK